MASDIKFDSMKLSLFEIVPGERTPARVSNGSLDTKLALSGAGHPRALVVSLSTSKLFELVGGLLSACSKIDPEETARALRGALSHVTSSLDPVSHSPTEAIPGVASDREDNPTSEIVGFIRIAKTIQDQGRKSGLSDQATAALISLVLSLEAVRVDESDVSDRSESSNGLDHEGPPK